MIVQIERATENKEPQQGNVLSSVLLSDVCLDTRQTSLQSSESAIFIQEDSRNLGMSLQMQICIYLELSKDQPHSLDLQPCSLCIRLIQ